MEYDKIVNPITNRKVSIHSKLGKSLLKKYSQNAGYYLDPKSYDPNAIQSYECSVDFTVHDRFVEDPLPTRREVKVNNKTTVGDIKEQIKHKTSMDKKRDCYIINRKREKGKCDMKGIPVNAQILRHRKFHKDSSGRIIRDKKSDVIYLNDNKQLAKDIDGFDCTSTLYVEEDKGKLVKAKGLARGFVKGIKRKVENIGNKCVNMDMKTAVLLDDDKNIVANDKIICSFTAKGKPIMIGKMVNGNEEISEKCKFKPGTWGLDAGWECK